MRRFDKHIPILSSLGDWARLRLILGGSFRFPVAAWPVAVVLSLDVEDVSRRGGSSEA